MISTTPPKSGRVANKAAVIASAIPVTASLRLMLSAFDREILRSATANRVLAPTLRRRVRNCTMR